jgi:hypothetical protein
MMKRSFISDISRLAFILIGLKPLEDASSYHSSYIAPSNDFRFRRPT